MSAISQQLEAVLERMKNAAERSGRKPDAVSLVAVSKTHPPEAIREALEAGQHIFGENKVQDLVAKAAMLPVATRWHFIGHLQSNKIRKLLPCCDLIHGVHSSELARDIERIASETGAFPKVLLEVNVSGESTKYGFRPDVLRQEIESLLALERVQVEGLMTMAPLADEAEKSRPYFAALRELRDEMTRLTGTPLTTLSMGMSGDFEIGIEEGATLVRVGTAIFGSRQKPVSE